MTKTTAIPVRTTPPTATLRETLGLVADVVIPTLAKGVIIRRPPVVALAERLNLDRRAVRRLQQLWKTYGSGPLLLRIPMRAQALILDPEHVSRVLDHSPEPFATDSSEKRAALAHFQPQGVLISHGPARADRRRFNEAVLNSDRPIHSMVSYFLPIVREEADHLLAAMRQAPQLNWAMFTAAWFRMVRRVVLGNAARDDQEITNQLARLRADANWAFLHPKRTALRHQFYNRLHEYLSRAEPGSLASVMASTPTTSITAPAQQVPQWLFAFDAAGMATFRTLALLAAHPQHAAQVQEEIASTNGTAPPNLPFLRACVLESLRLWPTTPMVLRQTTTETSWETGVLPAKTGILIYAPFFHRDDQRLPYAHHMAPELWAQPRSPHDWPLIPFSSGPAICPGRNLVLLLSTALLAALLDNRQVRLDPPNRLDARRPLPGTLNNYGLRFVFTG